jgi:hypothetical protein
VVTAAATLFESAPFILAAAVLLCLPLRHGALAVPYLGCGCGAGPSARSLPAAAAACVVFGPLAAGARLAAAILIDSLRRRSVSCVAHETSFLAQLALLLPLAAIAAAFSLLAPALFGSRISPVPAFFGAALLAFIMAPCGIGTVALAAATRAVMPAAAAGFLCVAGILDLRTWMRSAPEKHGHDAFAYLLAAAAFTMAAAHGGAGLLNPRFTPALWLCAAACCAWAYRYRGERSMRLRIAPALMLAGSVLAAPPPAYHATETTLADAFAGERVDFTGAAAQSGAATTLVRYAITCCRADAAPVAVRLERRMPRLHGWFHARGVLIAAGSELRLHTSLLQRIPPPADPFVYR